jgi:hypothetical protein
MLSNSSVYINYKEITHSGLAFIVLLRSFVFRDGGIAVPQALRKRK